MALYGFIQSVLLWYKTFKTKLQKKCFKLNTYDLYIDNTCINGKQCTIFWYVDDTKIINVKSKVVDGFIEMLEQEFGRMKVKRGKEYTFVGMDMIFTTDGKVEIFMERYLQECIKTHQPKRAYLKYHQQVSS